MRGRVERAYLTRRFHSTSASTRRARRSDATTFEQNKQILSTFQRTAFNTDVCSYFSFSHLDCDPTREFLTPEVNQLTMLCGVKAMSNSGKLSRGSAFF